jgi:hypothetical protein
MSAVKTFYTYLWLREDGTPYYVGKGHSKRAIRKGSPQDLSRILIQEHESEQDAFTAEVFLIAYYGRIDLGTGCLRNRTDGGEGHSNPSAETRHKIAESKRNLSQESRRKLSDAKKHQSEETRRLIGEANRKAKLGYPLSATHRANIGKGLLGHEMSTEARLKSSQTQRKTHCWRGHLLSSENRTTNGSCKECGRIRATAYHLQHKGNQCQPHQ